eukprot:TRINITY_DN28669_c0_g1_i1.p3 TRINITY_DN28669_c0_g1~~TRINITY_DN28669_c0_g1_i1.p3  ORF type:complete len:163 (-),score=44.00 TRINITY_DN28669_c0_g1_i1:505-993(-)
MYDVYKFDPLILINMFHLQSSETLRNLSPELFEDIQALSRRSLDTLTTLFQDIQRSGRFLDLNPAALADILWSLFSGTVLRAESKRIIDEKAHQLEDTLSLAFGIFSRGIRREAGESIPVPDGLRTTTGTSAGRGADARGPTRSGLDRKGVGPPVDGNSQPV